MSITDLFIVGLGLDIAGAALLAKGLLASSAVISALASWEGVGYGSTVARCRDRVDAEVGIAALGLGFICQLFGYVASLAGAGIATGVWEAVVGTILALTAVAVVFLFWWRVKERALKALLVVVAVRRPRGVEDGSWTYDRVHHLTRLGISAGWLSVDSDRFEQGLDRYVCRVFGIEAPRFLPSPDLLERMNEQLAEAKPLDSEKPPQAPGSI